MAGGGIARDGGVLGGCEMGRIGCWWGGLRGKLGVGECSR